VADGEICVAACNQAGDGVQFKGRRVAAEFGAGECNRPDACAEVEKSRSLIRLSLTQLELAGRFVQYWRQPIGRNRGQPLEPLVLACPQRKECERDRDAGCCFAANCKPWMDQSLCVILGDTEQWLVAGLVAHNRTPSLRAPFLGCLVIGRPGRLSDLQRTVQRWVWCRYVQDQYEYQMRP
jgi:hypothetical protein